MTLGSWRSAQEAWLRGDEIYSNFCMIYVTKFRKSKGRQALIYPDISLFIAPVPYDNSLWVPHLPLNVTIVLYILSNSISFVLREC